MTMSARRPRPDRTRSVREWKTAKAARVPSRSTAGGDFYITVVPVAASVP